MTRRSLLAFIAGLPFALQVGQRPAAAREIVGPMSLERERMLATQGFKVSTFHRGVDVTRRCQFADDTPGHEVARLLKHNADGRPYLDRETGDVARETVTGDIRISVEREHA